MPTSREWKRAVERRPAIVALASGILVAAVWCWLESRACASRRNTVASLVRQVESMRGDGARIRELQSAPRTAVERERPNDELVAEIHAALGEAGIAADRWISHDPVPTTRVPQSPYKQCGVRLALRGITMRQLVQFAFALTESTGALSIPRIHLAAPKEDDRRTWDVNMTLRYLIYAPHMPDS